MKFFKEIKEIIFIIAVVVFFRSSLLNWYLIPSSSMLPTLKIGDHVLVNKLSYGFMLPFMEKRVFSWASPKRGDLVVFQGPLSEGGQVVIKRVVGISGDNISFTNGILTINGIAAKENIELNREILEDLAGADTPSSYNIFSESGFSRFSHFILRKKNGGITADEKKSWIVPKDKLLCIGDNRDNSYDGRFWGFTDEKYIYGKAFLIIYSTGEKGIWPHFRSERWFMKLTN